jgi:hypothetical protein
MARTGQKDKLWKKNDNTARRGHLGYKNWDRIAGTDQSVWTGHHDKSTWTGQPEQNRRTGQPGHDSNDRIAGTRELGDKSTETGS